MSESLTLKDLQSLIKFAKAEGIPRIKVGDFECEIPPKDATRKELDEIHRRLSSLDAVTQRLSLQAEKPKVDLSRPFTARVMSGRKGE